MLRMGPLPMPPAWGGMKGTDMTRSTNDEAAKGRGRPKGSRNKITNEAKQAILMAFDKLGGVDRLVEWVEKDPANETLFWTRIFSRLTPRPAPEVVAGPEALPPVRGALTWRTPDWAKQLQTKASLRSGVSEAALAVSMAALRQGSGQANEAVRRSGELPPNDWEEED